MWLADRASGRVLDHAGRRLLHPSGIQLKTANEPGEIADAQLLKQFAGTSNLKTRANEQVRQRMIQVKRTRLKLSDLRLIRQRSSLPEHLGCRRFAASTTPALSPEGHRTCSATPCQLSWHVLAVYLLQN
jgi:hypothetical protein